MKKYITTISFYVHFDTIAIRGWMRKLKYKEIYLILFGNGRPLCLGCSTSTFNRMIPIREEIIKDTDFIASVNYKKRNNIK